ncbi:hypothetical protein BsWGS_00384 [Bradybaena similaris]
MENKVINIKTIGITWTGIIFIYQPLRVWIFTHIMSITPLSHPHKQRLLLSFHHSVICLVMCTSVSIATVLKHGCIAGPAPSVLSYDKLEGALVLFFLTGLVQTPANTQGYRWYWTGEGCFT